MKEKLECIWLCVQIATVIVAGVWAYNVWVVGDSHKLHPQVMSTTGEVISSWVNDSKSACMLATVWGLNNSGDVPAHVKNIKLSISSITDNYDFSFEGSLKDYGADVLEKNAIQHGTIELENSTGVLQAGGGISRDISIAFNPDDKNNEAWFSKNRVMLKIEATVYNKDVGGSEFTSSMKTRFKYQCHKTEG